MLNTSLKARDPVEMKCKIIIVIIWSVLKDRLSTVILSQIIMANVIAKQARFGSKSFLIINTFQMNEYLTQSFSYDNKGIDKRCLLNIRMCLWVV